MNEWEKAAQAATVLSETVKSTGQPVVIGKQRDNPNDWTKQFMGTPVPLQSLGTLRMQASSQEGYEGLQADLGELRLKFRSDRSLEKLLVVDIDIPADNNDAIAKLYRLLMHTDGLRGAGPLCPQHGPMGTHRTNKNSEIFFFRCRIFPLCQETTPANSPPAYFIPLHEFYRRFRGLSRPEWGHGTVTGRISSRDPAMKTSFGMLYGAKEGQTYLGVDYAGLELSTMARIRDELLDKKDVETREENKKAFEQMSMHITRLTKENVELKKKVSIAEKVFENFAQDHRKHYTRLDAAFRFFCGLNLQDHPVKEQREFESAVRELQAVLRYYDPQKGGRDR